MNGESPKKKISIRIPVCKDCRTVVTGMEMGETLPKNARGKIPGSSIHWACPNLDCPSRNQKKNTEVEWVSVGGYPDA